MHRFLHAYVRRVPSVTGICMEQSEGCKARGRWQKRSAGVGLHVRCRPVGVYCRARMLASVRARGGVQAPVIAASYVVWQRRVQSHWVTVGVAASCCAVASDGCSLCFGARVGTGGEGEEARAWRVMNGLAPLRRAEVDCACAVEWWVYLYMPAGCALI